MKRGFATAAGAGAAGESDPLVRGVEAGASGAGEATRPQVGQILAVDHPTLRGRVHVRLGAGDGARQERWLPTLQGLPVRPGDRVVVVHPENWPEPVVTGVIDGYARRPEAARDGKVELVVETDESVRVVARDGTDLVEVFQAATGPVVRLAHGDVALELAGGLRLTAAHVELKARDGSVDMQASDDINLRAETINLN